MHITPRGALTGLGAAHTGRGGVLTSSLFLHTMVERKAKTTRYIDKSRETKYSILPSTPLISTLRLLVRASLTMVDSMEAFPSAQALILAMRTLG